MSKCSQTAHIVVLARASQFSSRVHNRCMVAQNLCYRGSHTREEFKLIPYSGDDEQWPQWFLKFEAWSELVGCGQNLDVASQSTHPIVNWRLQIEVQSISRQLYAILVVKLEGKALGIVQLVAKGEGLEAWRQLKLESRNRRAALLRWFSTQDLVGRPTQEMDARAGRIAEQVGEDHQPLSDSQR